MRKKWTIEVMADFVDTSKFAFIDERVIRKAMELQALIGLMADEQKPKVSAFSEDFFVGRDELDIMASDIQPPSGDGISDEMMEMLGKK